MMKAHSTSKPIAFLVVGILGLVGLSALWMGYDLVRSLIQYQGKPETLAVFVGLIGGVFAICTGALGYIGGTLNATEKQHQGTTVQNAEKVESGGPTQVTPGGE